MSAPETSREMEAKEMEDPCGRDQKFFQDSTIFSALSFPALVPNLDLNFPLKN